MQLRPSNLFLQAGLAVLITFTVAGQQQDPLALKSRQAKSLLAQGRFAVAIPLYEELVHALPGNPGLLLNLGTAEHMAGRDREAAATLAEVLRVEPNHGPALAMSGATYLRLGDPAKAVGFLESALRVMQQDNDVLQMLADAALMSGKFGSAASALRALAKIQPGEPRIWAGLGHSHEALSEEAFARFDSLASGSPYWLALAAETRLLQRQFRGALALFREALAKLNRRDWRETVAAEQTDHPDWAVAEKGKAAKLAPPPCAKPSAECHFLAKRYLLAAESPGQTAEALYWRSKAYNELAREAFAQLSRFPDSVEWHSFLGNLYRNQGKFEESTKEWQAVIGKRAGDLDLERELAATMLAGKEYLRAETALRTLVEKAPDNAELWWMLGEALMAQQKLEDAAKAIRHIAHRYNSNGLDRALYDKQRPGAQQVLDDSQKQRIVAMVCSQPPEGRARWTIRLIVEEAIHRKLVPNVGRETIRILLQSHELKPWREKNVVCGGVEQGIHPKDGRRAGRL